MSVTLVDCANQLHNLAVDSTILSGCWQAEATRRAGKLAAKASTLQAYLTLLTGIFAILAGAFVFITARWQAKYNRLDMCSKMSSAYIGDITAVQIFLQEREVITNLGSAVRFYFHPGDGWLKIYSSNPIGVGVFSGPTPEQLITYCSLMEAELGRLIWLHELTNDQIATNGGNDWLEQEYKQSKYSLEKLFLKGDALLTTLGDIRTNCEIRMKRIFYSSPG